MPKFLTEDNDFIPMSAATLNLSSGVIALPTGSTAPAVSTETVDSASVVGSGQAIFIPASGCLILASGTDVWFTITFE